MNDNPRLGFFDVDAEKFSAMMDELLKKGVVDMANYNDDEWIGVDDGMIDVESFGEMIEDDYYNDSTDGDWDSAMASAGFGTDEDYGIFDDYNDFYGEE